MTEIVGRRAEQPSTGASAEAGRPSAVRNRLSSRCLIALAVITLAGCTSSGPGPGPSPGPTAKTFVGRTFYVSPDGDDLHDGLSPGRPWRSLERANSMVLARGDRVLLKGGARFPGALRIGQNEGGDGSAPIVVGSYGTGRATIASTGDSGISVLDTGGVEIHDLVVVGDAEAARRSSGLNFFSDLPDGSKLAHIAVSGVDVTGFKDGIAIGGGRGTTGFRDVRINNSVLHDNVEAGMTVYGPAFDAKAPGYAHEAVLVSHVEAYANAGDPAVHDRNTGSGIMLSSVRDARIEWSSAHDNGSSSGSPGEGPEGIWTYDSTGVVIEHNVSHDNHTGTKADGGGFGLDNNVTASVVQYNLAYGNDGPGYLLYMSQPDGTFTANTLRFNISHNDARKAAWYGSVHISGRVTDTQMYNNTVVTRSDGAVPSPALVLGSDLSHVVVCNNVLVTGSGALLVSAGAAYRPEQVSFQGNDYFSSASPWNLYWGDRTFKSLDSWRSATTQERSGSSSTGLDADPGFTDGTTRDLGKADALVPRGDSPLIGRALDLRSLFGVDQSAVDYFGRPISGSAAIGAAQPVKAG